MFESSVNSEGIETINSIITSFDMFESSVNSEGIETEYVGYGPDECLRAV